MLSGDYRGGGIVSTLYQGLRRSRISRKVIADNGGSIGGIDIDTIMISGPQKTACITDENIFLYGAIGRIEQGYAMLGKVPDGIAFDQDIGMVVGNGRHGIVKIVVDTYGVDLVDADVDGSGIFAEDVEPGVPDIVVHDPDVAAIEAIVPEGGFIVQGNGRG